MPDINMAPSLMIQIDLINLNKKKVDLINLTQTGFGLVIIQLIGPCKRDLKW
jgi:hypothetical protein